MKTIVVACRKGGAGKTTVVRHLAVEAERAGEGPVALIDADEMGGLSQWWNARAEERPDFVQSSLAEMPAILARLRQSGYRYAMIDTPPQASELVRAMIHLADLVLVPTLPSPDDLRAVGGTIDLVESEGKPVVFIINGANRRARLTAQTAIKLSQHGTVAPAIISLSTKIRESGIDGRTAVEIDPKGTPAREFAELWRYLSNRLNGKPASLPASQLVNRKVPA
jgi:chromosome partitioning protein